MRKFWSGSGAEREAGRWERGAFDCAHARGREIVALLQAADVKERLAKEGSTVVASTPEQLTQHLRAEIAKWEKVTRTAGIRLEATR